MTCIEQAGVRALVGIVPVAVVAGLAWVEDTVSTGALQAAVGFAALFDRAILVVRAGLTSTHARITDTALAKEVLASFGAGSVSVRELAERACLVAHEAGARSAVGRACTRSKAHIEAAGVVASVAVVPVAIVARLGGGDRGQVAVTASLQPVGRAVAVVIRNTAACHGHADSGAACWIARTEAVPVERIVEPVGVVIARCGQHVTNLILVRVEGFIRIIDAIGIGIGIEVVGDRVPADERPVGIRR